MLHKLDEQPFFSIIAPYIILISTDFRKLLKTKNHRIIKYYVEINIILARHKFIKKIRQSIQSETVIMRFIELRIVEVKPKDKR